MRHPVARTSVGLLLALLASCGGGGDGGGGGGSASPPLQAPSGPGGADYVSPGVVERTYGSGDLQYWIVEPSVPGAGTHPLVVFLHGFGAFTPAPYRPWLEHLAKKGNVVVYPIYQSSIFTPPATFTGNVVASVQAAIARIQAGGHAAIDLARAGVAGHSFGGVLAANLAAVAAAQGLPTFRAVMCATPGTAGFGVYEDFSDIPTGTLLLSIAAADDGVVGDVDAKRIFREATAVPLADKDYLTLLADRHGTTPLLADHGQPTCLEPPGPDAHDWYGFWKWFDALLDAAFAGANRVYALGNTPEQRHLGTWGDGVPVVEALVTDAP